MHLLYEGGQKTGEPDRENAKKPPEKNFFGGISAFKAPN